jgi:DNA modification methylase
MLIEQFDDGIAVCGDATDADVLAFVAETCGPLPLIVADPPYGNIVAEKWDRTKQTQAEFATWMMNWSSALALLAAPGGAFYLWGGYGIPGFRPFFEYASRVEAETPWRVGNLITWSKRRAYGVQNNYLSTREELLYMVNGDHKRPRLFNVPYLDTKRDYAGYDPNYPAKSDYYRRTSVWTDVTELFSGKVHPTQKPTRVVEIPVEVHTKAGEWIFDPFAGSMTTAWAARKLGRKWLCVERDEAIFRDAVAQLREGERKR